MNPRQEKLGPTILLASISNAVIVVVGIALVVEWQKSQFRSAMQEAGAKMQERLKPKTFDEPVDRRSVRP